MKRFVQCSIFNHKTFFGQEKKERKKNLAANENGMSCKMLRYNWMTNKMEEIPTWNESAFPAQME